MMLRPTLLAGARRAALAVAVTGALLAGRAGDAAAQGPVSLAVDQATVLTLAKPAATIVLGNPLIADAAVQDATTLILTGRSFGVTNIIVLDNDGAQVLNTQLSVSAGVASSHIVTVHRGTQRASLSCTPECEQAPMVGDSQDAFSLITSQISARNDLSLVE